MDLPNFDMDFGLNDGPMPDPFLSLSLDTELQDIGEVIRRQNITADGLFRPDPQAPHQQHPQQSRDSIEDRIYAHLPEEEKVMEIDNIVSILRDDSTDFQPNHDLFGKGQAFQQQGNQLTVGIPHQSIRPQSQQQFEHSPHGLVLPQNNWQQQPQSPGAPMESPTYLNVTHSPNAYQNTFNKSPSAGATASAFCETTPEDSVQAILRRPPKSEFLDLRSQKSPTGDSLATNNLLVQPKLEPTVEELNGRPRRATNSSLARGRNVGVATKMGGASESGRSLGVGVSESGRGLNEDRGNEVTGATPGGGNGRMGFRNGRSLNNERGNEATGAPPGDGNGRLEFRSGRRGTVEPVKVQSPSPSGDDSEEDESMTNESGRNSKQPKTERRSNHNLIEKKYRCSINDKIGELKSIIAGPDSKMSKATILRKSIEFMRHMRKRNEELMRENEQLRAALGAQPRDHAAPLSSVASPYSVTGSGGDAGSESSSPGSPEAFGFPSRHQLQLPPSRDTRRSRASGTAGTNQSTKNNRSMMDRSKITLCVFMTCVLFMNPFQLMFNGVTSGSAEETRNGAALGGRTLLSAFEEHEQETWWKDALFRVLCLWLLNGIVISCVLARLLIYGEPVTDAKSHSGSLFRRFRMQAEDDIKKGNLWDASFHLSECLRVLGRPLPQSSVDEWSSFLWQVLRHVLNRAFIGKWMSKQRRGGLKPQSVMESHGQAALVYHQLHKLHLLEQAPGGHLTGLTLALSAVNLAEAAGKMCRDRDLVEIYVLADLRAKHSFRFVEGYFMNRGKTVAKKTSARLSPHLSWVFHAEGQKFWKNSQDLGVGGKPAQWFPFCTIKNVASPMEFAAAAFKLELLQRLASCLIAVNQSHTPARRDRMLNVLFSGYRYGEILTCSHLLLEASRPWDESLNSASSAPTTLTMPDAGDELCVWWTELLTCAVYWAVEDLAHAKEKYQHVRNVPKDLLSDHLAQALGNAFCAQFLLRKICTEKETTQDQTKYQTLVWIHCGKAKHMLEIWSKCGRAVKSTALLHLQESAALLVYEWVLWGLSDLWRLKLKPQKPYWLQPGWQQLVSLYQQILTAYRHADDGGEQYEVKTMLYEACGRMLSGANPVSTWQLLHRCNIIARQSTLLTDEDKSRLRCLSRLHAMLGKSDSL